MKKKIKALKRFGMALLLLPACYGVTLGFWHLLRPFQNVPEGSFYFLAGIGSYFAFQWVFFRPMRTYVFGHELTHAVAAWLSGGKVKHFHVSKKGGSVTVTKSNVFVALAPYIVPLYALLFLGVIFALTWFYPSLRRFWQPFLWVLGASLGFHMALTAYALKQDQPDLKSAGKLLSAILIYLGNTVSVVFILGVLFPKTVSWTRFARVSGDGAVSAVKNVTKGSYIAWQSAAKTLADPPKP